MRRLSLVKITAMKISPAHSAGIPRMTEALVPHIVDHRASTHPDALYSEYPVSCLEYEQGYRRITYADLANAVNGIAWWLYRTLGPGQNHEVLAYIGPNDLRYPALILGAAKAGYVVCYASAISEKIGD